MFHSFLKIIHNTHSRPVMWADGSSVMGSKLETTVTRRVLKMEDVDGSKFQ